MLEKQHAGLFDSIFLFIRSLPSLLAKLLETVLILSVLIQLIISPMHVIRNLQKNQRKLMDMKIYLLWFDLIIFF